MSHNLTSVHLLLNKWGEYVVSAPHLMFMVIKIKTWRALIKATSHATPLH